MGRLLPKQAIKQECRYCMNNSKITDEVGCYNESCHLNKLEVRHLTRIKNHCLQCVPSQSIFGVQACDGKVLNPTPHICPLHEFRLGKNVRMSRKGNIENIAKFQFKKADASGKPFITVESQNGGEKVLGVGSGLKTLK